MLLFRDAKTGGALPPKRRMETAHERLLPNRLAVQHAGAGDSNTANTIAVLHPACRTDANTLVPCRTVGLRHTDAPLKLRGGGDNSLVERMGQLRKFLYYSYCILHNTMGECGDTRQLRHRQSHLVRCVWQPVRERAAHLHQRTAFGNIHVPNLHTRRGDLHAARRTDANTRMSHGTDGDMDSRTHLDLHHGCDVSDVERVDGHGENVYPDTIEHNRCISYRRPEQCRRIPGIVRGLTRSACRKSSAILQRHDFRRERPGG